MAAETPPWQKTYNLLLEHIETVRARYGRSRETTLACRPGCYHCCKPFGVFALEAHLVSKAIEALLPGVLAGLLQKRNIRLSSDLCPLLTDEGLCAIYPSRPVICRTQGMILAWKDENRPDRIMVDWCDLSLPHIDPATVQQDLLVDLDRLNELLAAANMAFLEEHPQWRGRLRWPLDDLLCRAAERLNM